MTQLNEELHEEKVKKEKEIEIKETQEEADHRLALELSQEGRRPRRQAAKSSYGKVTRNNRKARIKSVTDKIKRPPKAMWFLSLSLSLSLSRCVALSLSLCGREPRLCQLCSSHHYTVMSHV